MPKTEVISKDELILCNLTHTHRAEEHLKITAIHRQ